MWDELFSVLQHLVLLQGLKQNLVDFSTPEDHQIEKSPLTLAGIPCIRPFALDYMHLVCLGVVRRMSLHEGRTQHMQTVFSEKQ